MSLEFRKAKMRDLETVCALVTSAVANMHSHSIEQWDELYPTADDLRADIEKSQMTLGEIDGAPAVIFTLNQECEEEYASADWARPDVPYLVLHRLCVSPQFQHQGVARQTLHYIEETLPAGGIHALRLDAFSGNPFALRLYASLGYRNTGFADWRKGRFILMEKYFGEDKDGDRQN